MRAARPPFTLAAILPYLRLVDQRLPHFENRKHIYGVAARVMRQVLVDYARSRKAKRITASS